jgi:dipeptidyl-peptidase 4
MNDMNDAIAGFPRLRARTLRFSCGAPRSVQAIGDGRRALFLRSNGSEDRVTALWMSVVDGDGLHREVLLADPRELLADTDHEDVPAEELARRERARESGGGIVSYSVDAAGRRVAFTVNGQLFVSQIDADDDGSLTRQIVADSTDDDMDDGAADGGDGVEGAAASDGDAHASQWLPVLNPRISPDGRHIAYTTGTRLVIVDIAEWGDDRDEGGAWDQTGDGAAQGARRPRPHTCAAEMWDDANSGNGTFRNASGDLFSTVWAVGDDPEGVCKIGLAEFVAGEEMDRYDGFWWAPDAHGIVFEMYDASPEPMWYISDPANPSKPTEGRRYARALTNNADVRLMLAHLDFNEPDGAQYTGCDVQNISWDRKTYEYVAAVHWQAGHGPLVLVQNRLQTRDQVLEVEPTGRTRVLEEHANDQWIDIVLGVPAFTPGTGRLVCALNDMDTDTNRLTVDGRAFTPVGWQVREVLDVSDENVLAVVQRTPVENLAEPKRTGAAVDTDASRAAMEIASERDSMPTVPAAWRGDEGLHDARSFDVVTIDFNGTITPVSAVPGVWTASRAGTGMVLSGRGMADAQATVVHALAPSDGAVVNDHDDNDGCDTSSTLTDDDGYTAACARLGNQAVDPGFIPNTRFVRLGEHRQFTAITRPSEHSDYAGAAKLPVLLKPYGGPGFQQATFGQAGYWESQWWADQGFLVVTADGRGTTGRGPKWDREIFEDMKTVPLADQVEVVRALPDVAPEADLDHVAMIGWSFGGFLSALAVLDAPDVVHAACAGAPPTDWTLYDTHYTERYLGLDPEVYERSSIVQDAPKLTRPLMLIHGFADDNVTIAHSLRLSQALMAAGRPHTYLPLTGITHMTNDETVAENLLTLQRDFLYDALGMKR